MVDEQGRPVTLRMIAAETGVHVSTVSRVLNAKDGDVSRWAAPETAERIREMARNRGYRRNVYASNLRTARSHLVGVIVPRLQDFVLATIYEGIDEAAIDLGYSTFVMNSLDVEENRQSRTAMMLERRVGGLIFGDAHLDDPFLDDLQERGVPFVLVSRRTAGHTSVTCDDYAGGRLVADHLIATGRRKVAVLAGLPFASTAADRVRGLVDGFHEAGLDVPDKRIVYGPFDAAGGRKAAEEILASGQRPDSIFATNDFAAIGALGTLRDSGLAVPEDVAVVGFNDTPLAAEMTIPLTTVRSPMHDMGRRSFELLVQRMQGERPESEKLKPELIVRASSRPSTHME
ncbi:MAG TPA: LacI family DNA-binding transcriptional regulator [Arthrobacter sp.]|nr:LacI family DNA-binding transcriptional regulator [Arthrobacter sp.]